MTTIHNKYKEDFEVYIGRPSIFGNPFELGKDGNREEVVDKYKIYFYDRIEKDQNFKNALLMLKNKRLGCFCKPKLCHGDVICEYLNKEFQIA